MRRIDVEYGKGMSTVLFSIIDNKFYDWEQDGEILHKKYGGESYYSSRSGLSGAGYLEPALDDLIEFGYYRTDAAMQQHREFVHYDCDGNLIGGYAPIRSHEGFDSERPFILTDGKKVVFTAGDCVKQQLLGWDKIEWDEKTLKYFVPGYCEPRIFEWKFYNPLKMGGVRTTRFLDLRKAKKWEKDALIKEQIERQKSLFAEKTKIYKMYKSWYHIHVDHFLDQMWKEDPREIAGPIVSGWQGLGDGLFWRQTWDNQVQVEAFMEVPYPKEYQVENSSEYIHYEENFSKLKWFSIELEKSIEYFQRKILKKVRHEYVWRIKEKKIAEKEEALLS